MDIKYIDHNPEEWRIIETDQFKITDGKDKRLFVVDNFYEDPIAVREFALSQYYFDDPGYLGMRTRKQFLFKGVKKFNNKAINDAVIIPIKAL